MTLDDLVRRALDLAGGAGGARAGWAPGAGADRAAGAAPASGAAPTAGAAGPARAVLGIAGSPGSGKTTLARAVTAGVNALAGTTVAVHVPMDGFHLANTSLDALGRRDRKGAIDTFDAWGFLALVQRLRTELDHAVYAPAFERAVDEPVAGSIAVDPSVRLVVTEGNYLLVDAGPWSRIPPLLAESWFVATPASEREERLVDRHTRHGRTPEAALAWARDVDGANAALIEATRDRATLVVDGRLPGIGA